MDKTVAVSVTAAEKFDKFIKSGRILMFNSPCGFGKTTVAKVLIKKEGIKATELTFKELAAGQSFNDSDIVLIDDIQNLNDDERKNLCSYVASHPEQKFILISRGAIPGDLIPFRIAGVLDEVCEEDLFFSRQMLSEYLSERGIKMSETELNALMKLTSGYPAAIEVCTDILSRGSLLDRNLYNDVLYRIYEYWDEMIFCRFDLPMRRFIMELAPFESFSVDLAKMISGNVHAGELLVKIKKTTRMLKSGQNGESYFWEHFRKFLMWETEHYCTDKQIKALYSRGGLYYELHEEYVKALEFYTKSGESDKVSELIIKIMAKHPGMGYYEDLEDYYNILSDETVSQSPALMQGKSMLCALKNDYDTSEYWYGQLKEFAEVRRISDAAAREAKHRLVWLDISLPQRTATVMENAIERAFELLESNETDLMPVSVTSNLPSIINGGKDFSEWCKKDDELNFKMKNKIEAVMGRDGFGLMECAVAESKFEKGENISERMLSLVSKLSEIRTKGTADIEFAIISLIARSRSDSGKAEEAWQMIEEMRSRFKEAGDTRFLPNIDAMLLRIALRTNNEEYIEEWYRERAPKDSLNIKVMKRYCYFSRAMAEVARGDYEAALLTLSPLEPYFIKCKRYLDLIQFYVISAIARFGQEDIRWRDDLKSAVGISKEYGFVRPIGIFGAAVLPLLEEICDGDEFSEKLIKTARNQAINYPDLMKPKSSEFEKLTEAELQVLKLVCADKSNGEIGEILNIRLATVKSHMSHILQKLRVSRRSEAKTKAEKLHLI